MLKKVAVLIVSAAVLGMTAHTAVAEEAVVAAEASAAKYAKAGFATVLEKGRLWVFRDGSKELADFHKFGEPTIANSKIGAGPDGITVKGPSMDVIDAYLSAP